MLDAASRPLCHDDPRHRLPESLRCDVNRRSAGIDVMLAAMSEVGTIMSLDSVLEMLTAYSPNPYDVVAGAVREKLFVVEFEAEPRPFPFREILIRRL